MISKSSILNATERSVDRLAYLTGWGDRSAGWYVIMRDGTKLGPFFSGVDAAQEALRQEGGAMRVPPECAKIPSTLVRLALMEALQEASLWDEAKLFNATTDETILHAAVDFLRWQDELSGGRANSAASVLAKIEKMCADAGIVLPPVNGGCWRAIPPKAVGNGGARCSGSTLGLLRREDRT